MIEVRNLKVRFGNKVVLDGLNLKVEKGESLVIIGPSGCGKTVFLKTILGLIEPEEGEIIIDGRNIVKCNKNEIFKIRGKMGMVFQSSALFDSLSVWENVGFYFLHHSKLGEKEVKEKVREILKAVKLEGVEDLMPEELSGGMKKRVAIARALISKPEILLYDEPTTGLDPITSKSIMQLMKEIHENFGTTDITVTHDIKLTSFIAERIAVLENGKINETGSFEELMKKSENALIKSFLEMERKNEERNGN
ncbi:MAG TPA: ATP-binding cassette domain-containing protein [bacterium]|nr:ATP-binding cassette domain-containing protein [bacterium]